MQEKFQMHCKMTGQKVSYRRFVQIVGLVKIWGNYSMCYLFVAYETYWAHERNGYAHNVATVLLRCFPFYESVTSRCSYWPTLSCSLVEAFPDVFSFYALLKIRIWKKYRDGTVPLAKNACFYVYLSYDFNSRATEVELHSLVSRVYIHRIAPHTFFHIDLSLSRHYKSPKTLHFFDIGRISINGYKTDRRIS